MLNIKNTQNLKPTLNLELLTCTLLYTAQNSSDNFLSYPLDNHHSQDDVYWRGDKKTE